MSKDLIQIAEDSARGGFFLFSGAFVATVVGAVTAILLARFLGPDLYGQYTLSLVITEMLVALPGFGLAKGVVKFAASLRAEGKISRATIIIKHAVLLRTLTALPFFLLNFVLADFLAASLLSRSDLSFLIRAASTTILFQTVGTVSTSAFLGLDKTEYNALTNNIFAVSKAIISIGLVLLGFGVAGAVLGHVAGWVIGGLLGLSLLMFVLGKSNRHNNDDGLLQTFKTLTNYGIPIYMVAVLGGFVLPYLNVVLGIFASNVDVGNWKAAHNFMALLTVVSIPITTILFPAFSKLNSAKNEKTKTFFKFVNKYTTLMILPITTLLMIFSREAIQIVYGSTYQTAAFFLSVYCLLYFLVGLGNLTLTSLFNGLGETRITLKAGLITLLIILTLSPLLTRVYGVLGAIAALIVANAAGTCYGMYVAKRRFQLEFETRSLIKIYLAALVSAVPSLLLLQISTFPELVTMVVGGALYLFTYATLMPVTGIVNYSELGTITEITKGIKILYPILKPLLKYQKKILNHQEARSNK